MTRLPGATINALGVAAAAAVVVAAAAAAVVAAAVRAAAARALDLAGDPAPVAAPPTLPAQEVAVPTPEQAVNRLILNGPFPGASGKSFWP